jgi:hypothetical protein
LPITNRIFPADGYFVSHWEGRIHAHELIPAFEALMRQDDWKPGLNELADLSAADASGLQARDFLRLAAWATEQHRKEGVTGVRIAVYAPENLPFGLARVYEMAGEAEDLATTRVFRSLEEAEAWLKEG